MGAKASIKEAETAELCYLVANLLSKTNPKAIDNCLWVRSLGNFKMARDNFIKPFTAG